MSTREIVTLQFGHYANFVGAHFWNTQELSFDYTGTERSECNHDVLYREGVSTTGEVTYTPRLVLAELKGALRTLPETGGLPEPTPMDEDPPWTSIDIIKEPAPSKNQYLNDIDQAPATSSTAVYELEKEVESWTDFLYSRFHPRSVNVIREYQHGNEQNLFDTYPSGRSLWKSDYGDNFSDNIRKYVEECDSFQGFHVNLDATDGFAGLALGCIEHLSDEYSKTILAHPLIASHFSDNHSENQEDRDRSTVKDSVRLANFSITIQELSEHTKLFVPLCTGERGWRKPGNPRQFDGVNYNPEVYYHSAAILASAMDTLSLKYRQRSNQFTLSDVCADMTGYGRKMAAASLALPFLIKESEYLIDTLNDAEKSLLTSITPSCRIATDKVFQLITVRGVSENRLKAPMTEAKEQMHLPAYQCTSVKSMMELYFQANYFLSATDITACEKPLKVLNPYPKIFSSRLNRFGFLKDRQDVEVVASVPVVAGWHNGTFIADTLEKLHREVKRVKFSKLHRFREEGLEAAEFGEILDRLAEFKDTYEDDFQL